MAVVTPDGIVGKVVDAYPTASLVMLITDPTFAAGVVSQKNHVRGTLKGQGHGECLVDYVQNEEAVDNGEWFYTSGDDRIFPKGFPVGQVSATRNGKTFKEIYLRPSGMQGGGVEEVLVVLEGVHQQIPDGEMATPGYKILAPPTEGATQAQTPEPGNTFLATDADRLRQQYKQAGAAQNHVFGEGTPGSKPPDFTKIPGVRAAAVPPTAGRSTSVGGNAAPAPANAAGSTAGVAPNSRSEPPKSPVSKPPADSAPKVAARPVFSPRPPSSQPAVTPAASKPAGEPLPAPSNP
jgi:rod shape-determining protein MreC